MPTRVGCAAGTVVAGGLKLLDRTALPGTVGAEVGDAMTSAGPLVALAGRTAGRSGVASKS